MVLGKGWYEVWRNLGAASQVGDEQVQNHRGKEALGFLEKSKQLQRMKPGFTKGLVRRKKRIKS